MTTSVVEFRRYRLRPGARERLIDLFDREFVETQEAVGMKVIGVSSAISTTSTASPG
jgi:hypothetical protein